MRKKCKYAKLKSTIKLFSLNTILLAILGIIGCSDESGTLPKTSQGDLPKVTIGIQVSPAMTLVMVAKDKGFFQREGVDVEIKEFTAGKFALQAFLSGAVDFAVSGEVPVGLASLQENPIRVVAQVVEKTTNEVRVVAHRDGDITDPEKYFKKKKRKLATSFGGGPEFFTYSFLKRFNIAQEDVEIISQRPEDMPASLKAKSVDAISIFDPFAFIAEKKIGSDVITFADPTLYSEFYVLDVRPEQIREYPEIISNLLKGLVQAALFIEKHPEDAKKVLKTYTNLDSDIIDGVWDNFIFKPALTEALIQYWRAQAEWAIETGKVKPDTKIPEFEKIIQSQFLKQIKPGAVKL